MFLRAVARRWADENQSAALVTLEDGSTVEVTRREAAAWAALVEGQPIGAAVRFAPQLKIDSRAFALAMWCAYIEARLARLERGAAGASQPETKGDA